MTSPIHKATTFPRSERPLPPGTSASLHITHPTTSEQYKHTLANSQEWKGALSVEAYLRREEHLANLDLTGGGGITFWVLVDQDEDIAAEADRTVLAGCETLRKRAWVSQHGIVEEATCHGVASVFAPPEYRGRGYGERLIRELGKVLEEWQRVEGRRQLSILYSDIGKTFYSKSGWHPYTSSHVHLPPATSKSVKADLPMTQPITYADLATFCTTASSHVHEQLLARADQSVTAFALIPNHATISWHLAREDFVGRELFGKVPEVKGASVTYPASAGQEVGKAFALWTRMWYNSDIQQTKGNTMHILRLDVDTVKNSAVRARVIMALLHAAQHQAAEWSMGEVEIWSPEPETLEACQQLLELGGKRVAGANDREADENVKRYGSLVHREKESIACSKWYNSGSVGESGIGQLMTDSRTGRVTGLEWVANEKFCWC